MLNWLRGKPSEPVDPLLASWLSRLDAVAPGLGGRSLAYVTRGAGPAVLDELTRVGGASALKLYAAQGLTFERGRFLSAPRSEDIALYVRLARLLEAIARRDLPEKSWLLVFMLEIGELIPNLWPRRLTAGDWPWELVRAIIRDFPDDPSGVYRALFSEGSDLIGEVAAELAGIGEGLASEPHELLQALRASKAGTRLRALQLLSRWRLAPEVALQDVLVCAVGGAGQAREAAGAVLSLYPDPVVSPELERLARKGKPEERCHAIGWLAQRGADRALFQRLLEEGPPARVAQSLRQVLATSDPDQEVPLPELDELRETSVPPEAAAAMESLARWANQRPGATAVALDPALAYLEHGGTRPAWVRHLFDSEAERRVLTVQAVPGFTPLHFVRYLLMSESIGLHQGSWRLYSTMDELLCHYLDAHPEASLREIGRAFQTAVGDGSLIACSRLLEPHGVRLPLQPEQLWPYFTEHVEVLEMALNTRPGACERVSYYDRGRSRLAALEVLSTFPVVPGRLVEPVWEAALLGSRAERALAQECLSRSGRFEERLLAALRHPRQEARAAAAEWVARRRLSQAAPALKQALALEKQEVALVAFMDALEALGAPLDEFLDREGLEREAQKGLRGGVPAAMSWFEFSSLPRVRWKDSGQPLSSELIAWLLVKAWKLKSPEPTSLLRRYADLMEGSEALGRRVLELWIEHDTERAFTPEEARSRAEAEAPSMLSWQPAGTTLDRLVRSLTDGYLMACKGSAIGDKGLLAAAGSLAGESLVPLVANYLKQWYGNRAAQCKALLAMLARIDHPGAPQLLLSVATRFRTRGIQQEALRLVQELAERRQWTVEELSDRTLGTAGVGAELDYGTRQFSLRLGPRLELEIWEGERQLKALPEPRQEDDSELAGLARKQLSAWKKELKALLKELPERWFAAMATRRSWPVADFLAFILQHPVAGRLAQRQIWTAWEGEEPRLSFRPTEDRSLIDVAHREVSLEPAWQVRLAHALHMETGEQEAWAEHLADYRIIPLFAQIGKPVFRLGEDRSSATSLEDYRGHLVEAFKLRGRASKLGYSRGAAEDGGVFYRYTRLFPGLGLEVELEFSGNSLPEENRTVALLSLGFQQQRRRLRLGQVPAVLLSECYHDLQMFASDGTGFDPDWERKVY